MKTNESLTCSLIYLCILGKNRQILCLFRAPHAWLHPPHLAHSITHSFIFVCLFVCGGGGGVFPHFHLFMSVSLSASSFILPPKHNIHASNWTDDKFAWFFILNFQQPFISLTCGLIYVHVRSFQCDVCKPRSNHLKIKIEN